MDDSKIIIAIKQQVLKPTHQDVLNLNGFLLPRPFNPRAHELTASFRLTKFANNNIEEKMKTYRVQEEDVNKFVESVQEHFKNGDKKESDKFLQMAVPRIGVGLGCSVTPLRQGKLILFETTDFFYPLIDDPYLMGKIACTNILSDLYAMGVIECDKMLMLLGISTKMTKKERDVTVSLIEKGFKDAASEAGTEITGTQIVANPWCIIGGVASILATPDEFIIPDNAQVGDVLVLTKPLGTEIAINAYQYLDHPERWSRIKLGISEEDVHRAYYHAVDSMARSNRIASRLLHKFDAHAATDINSLGILGHAETLASHQKQNVCFVIHNLPVLANMCTVAKACDILTQFKQGRWPETSGGLFVALPHTQAAIYCKEIEKQEGYQAWIVGIVERGNIRNNRTARVLEKPRIIDIPAKD